MKTTGKLAAGICALGILAMGGSAYGQYALDLQPLDTIAARRVLPLEGGVVPGKTALFFPSHCGVTSRLRLELIPPIGVEPGFYSPAGPSAFREPIDLASPLRLERENERKMTALTNALGAVSAGAVVYMAYKHVSKYGFLK